MYVRTVVTLKECHRKYQAKQKAKLVDHNTATIGEEIYKRADAYWRTVNNEEIHPDLQMKLNRLLQGDCV